MSELLAGLPNAQLLARVRELVQRGNAVEAELLAHLGEVDARRLYLEEGCSSMFVYCQRVLHFAEGVRLQANPGGASGAASSGDPGGRATWGAAPDGGGSARAKAHDNQLRGIDSGRMPSERGGGSATARRPRAPACAARLGAQVPEPAKQASAAALPQVAPPRAASSDPSRTSGESNTPPPAPRQTSPERGVTEPLGAERYRVQFTADRALYEQLLELQALMRHQVPDGDLGEILARAVAVLLAEVRKRKFAETSAPRPVHLCSPKEIPSRHIPPSAAPSGGVTRADAAMSLREAGAATRGSSWSSTTQGSGAGRGPTRSAALRCAAARTISSGRASTSASSTWLDSAGPIQLDLNPVRRKCRGD